MLLQPDLEPEENPSSTLQIPVHRRFAAEAQTLLAGVLWALSRSRSLTSILQAHRTMMCVLLVRFFVINQRGLASPLSKIGSAWQKKHSPSAAHLAKIKSSVAKT